MKLYYYYCPSKNIIGAVTNPKAIKELEGISLKRGKLIRLIGKKLLAELRKAEIRDIEEWNK
jgi:hypothetical protein